MKGLGVRTGGNFALCRVEGYGSFHNSRMNGKQDINCV